MFNAQSGTVWLRMIDKTIQFKVQNNFLKRKKKSQNCIFSIDLCLKYCTPSQIIWLLWYELLELKQYLFGMSLRNERQQLLWTNKMYFITLYSQP